MLSKQAIHANVIVCHRCKPYSQTQRQGGCRGPCPCHYDGKDIVEHAVSGYCPMGRYPRRGLGSWITRLLWLSGIPRLLTKMRVYDPKTCGCAQRQEKLNALGRALAFWGRIKERHYRRKRRGE